MSFKELLTVRFTWQRDWGLPLVFFCWPLLLILSTIKETIPYSFILHAQYIFLMIFSFLAILRIKYLRGEHD